jgi:diadenosine tetraphosphate (Ap4A) HIT family hydrolase
MSTAIHRMVEACRAGTHGPAVARVPSGWVVMGEQQVLPGYCLLLPDPVVPDLNALAGVARSRFLTDLAVVGDALLALTAAIRINYAIFGNVEPALHAHLFPRLPSEPPTSAKLQPFALDWNQAPKFSRELNGEFRQRLAQDLKKRF